MLARYGTRWFARPIWSRIGAGPVWPGPANPDGLRLPIEDVRSDLLEIAPDGRAWSEGRRIHATSGRLIAVPVVHYEGSGAAIAPRRSPPATGAR
jgi:hypothetical protein